jgi:hypothetical protein
MGTAIAIVVVLICGFIIFIVWGKSDAGQAVLGRPLEHGHSFKRRQREARRIRALTASQKRQVAAAASRPGARRRSSGPKPPASAGSGRQSAPGTSRSTSAGLNKQIAQRPKK